MQLLKKWDLSTRSPKLYRIFLSHVYQQHYFQRKGSETLICKLKNLNKYAIIKKPNDLHMPRLKIDEMVN